MKYNKDTKITGKNGKKLSLHYISGDEVDKVLGQMSKEEDIWNFIDSVVASGEAHLEQLQKTYAKRVALRDRLGDKAPERLNKGILKTNLAIEKLEQNLESGWINTIYMKGIDKIAEITDEEE